MVVPSVGLWPSSIDWEVNIHLKEIEHFTKRTSPSLLSPSYSSGSLKSNPRNNAYTQEDDGTI